MADYLSYKEQTHFATAWLFFFLYRVSHDLIFEMINLQHFLRWLHNLTHNKYLTTVINLFLIYWKYVKRYLAHCIKSFNSLNIVRLKIKAICNKSYTKCHLTDFMVSHLIKWTFSCLLEVTVLCCNVIHYWPIKML